MLTAEQLNRFHGFFALENVFGPPQWLNLLQVVRITRDTDESLTVDFSDGKQLTCTADEADRLGEALAKIYDPFAGPWLSPGETSAHHFEPPVDEPKR